MAKQNKKQDTVRLSHSLVLNRFILSLFDGLQFNRNLKTNTKKGAKLESRPNISEPKNLKPEVNGNILQQRYIIIPYYANTNTYNDKSNNEPMDANDAA